MATGNPLYMGLFMGKSTINGWFSSHVWWHHVLSCLRGITKYQVPSGKHTNIIMEHQHFSWENSRFLWWFSIVFLYVYQRESRSHPTAGSPPWLIRSKKPVRDLSGRSPAGRKKTWDFHGFSRDFQKKHWITEKKQQQFLKWVLIVVVFLSVGC